MPHNKNADRTRRRLLRWVALLGSLGVVAYLFFPQIFPGQGAHDTAADPFADSLVHDLPPESIDLPFDSPELPPLIPPYLQDDELMMQLANEYNLQTPEFGGKAPDARYIVEVEETPEPEVPTEPASSETPVVAEKTPPVDAETPIIGARDLTREAPVERPVAQTVEPPQEPKAIADSTLKLEDHESDNNLLELARIGVRDLSRGETLPEPVKKAPEAVVKSPEPEPENDLAAIGARDLSEDVPENAVEMPPPASTAEMVVQDDSKGEFVKKRFSLQHKDIWNALQKSDLNPNLKRQLEPLRRRIAQGNINRVQILYTDYVKNGESKPENSKILLVDGMRGASLVWSFYAREKDRKMSFYDYDGNAPELAMDRIPLPYSHVTSEFNPARRHPITGRIQAHTGVDLKAPYGAPVHSTGKGVVIFAGWQSGYGRIVIVQHDNGYETRYAHLSAIEVDAGQAVARGAVVGKVGNSGISTGAHVHFEVRVYDTPYDPMSIEIPTGQSLPGNYMKAWHYRAEQYRLAMNKLSSTAKK